MAPVVHRFEQEYKERIDFLYLNVAEARDDSAKQALGFTSTPHFFFRRADGSTVKGHLGPRAWRQRAKRARSAPGTSRTRRVVRLVGQLPVAVARILGKLQGGTYTVRWNAIAAAGAAGKCSFTFMYMAPADTK